jgi:acetoin utilization deacetylase AcuC-like enzyme
MRSRATLAAWSSVANQAHDAARRSLAAVSSAITAFRHAACLEHDTGAGLFEAGPHPLIEIPEAHPENGDLLRNLYAALERGPLAGDVEWLEAPRAIDEELLTIHTREHIAAVDALAGADGVVHVEGQTWASSATPEAARRSAGAALAAAECAAAGESSLAFAMTRPPGHHCAPDVIDGYCFYSNAALAARRLRELGAARVAVVDWDVHHGNGTEACFWDDGTVLTISVHMDHRAWGHNHRQSGAVADRGAGAGLDANLNVPLPFGSGDRAYAAAIDEAVVPALRSFAPEAIVCAQGVDASQFDPNGRMCVSMAGFHRIGTAVGEAASDLGVRSLAVTREGGYARTYSAFCHVACVLGLLGRPLTIDDPLAYLPDDSDAHQPYVAAARAALST